MTIALRPAICAIILLGTVVPSKSQDWNPLFLSSMQRTGNAKQSQSLAQSQGVLESQPRLVLKPLQEIPPDYHPKFVIFGPKQNQRNPGLSGESQLLGVPLTRNSGSEDIAKQISDVQDRIEELKSQSSASPIESEQDNRTTSDLQDTLLQLQSQLSSQSSGSQSEFDSQSSGSQSQSQSGSQYVLKQISDLEPELGDLKPQSSEQTSLFSTPLNPEPKLTSDLQSTLFQVRSQLASQPSEEGLVPSPLNTELKSTLLELQSQMDSEPLGGAQSQIQSESSSQLGSRSDSQVQSNKQVSDLGEPLEEPQNSYGFNELPVPLEPEAQPTSDLQSTLLETQSQLDSQRSENGVPPDPELKSTLLELQSQIESQPLGSESSSQSSGSQPQDQVPDLQIPLEEQKGNPLRVRQLPNPLDRDANSTSDLQSTLLQVHSELNSQPSENGPLSLEPRSVVQSNILEVLSQLNSQSSASNSQSSGSQFQSNSQTSVSQSSSQSISQSSSQPNTQSSSQDQVSGLEKTLDEQYRNSLGVRLLPKPLDRDANSTSDLESTLLQLHAELNSLRSENGQLPNPLNPEYKSVVQSNILEALSQLYSQTSTSAGSQSQSNSQSSVSQSSSQSKSQSSSQSSGSQSQSSGSQSQLQSISSSQSGLQSTPNSQSAGLQARLQFKLNSQPSSSQPQVLPQIANSDPRFQFKWNSQPQVLLQTINSDQLSQSLGSQSQSAGSQSQLQSASSSQSSGSQSQSSGSQSQLQSISSSSSSGSQSQLQSASSSQSSGSQSQSSGSQSQLQSATSSQSSGSQSQSSGSQSQLQSISSPQSGLQSTPNSQSAGLQARLQFKLNPQPSSSQPQLPQSLGSQSQSSGSQSQLQSSQSSGSQSQLQSASSSQSSGSQSQSSGSQSQLQSASSSQSSGSQSQSSGSQSQLQSATSSQSSGSQSQSSGSQSQLQSISSSQPGLQSAPNSQSAGLQARLQFKLNPQPSSSQPQVPLTDRRMQFKWNSQPQLLLQTINSDQLSQSSGSQSQSSGSQSQLQSATSSQSSGSQSQSSGSQSQLQSISSSQSSGSKSHSQPQVPLTDRRFQFKLNPQPSSSQPQVPLTDRRMQFKWNSQPQLLLQTISSDQLSQSSGSQSQSAGSQSQLQSASSSQSSGSQSQSSGSESQLHSQSSGSQPQDQVPDLEIPLEEQKGNPLRVRQLRDTNSTSDLQSTLLQVHSELNSQPSENGPLSLEPRSVVQSNILEVLSQLNSQSSASNSQSSGSEFQSNSQSSVLQSSSQSISQSSSQPNTQSSSQDQVSGLEKTLDEQKRNSLGVRLLPKPLDRDANSTSDLESTLLQLHAELNSLRSENGQLPNQLNPEYKSVVQSNILEALSQLYSQTSTSQSAGSQSQSNSQSSVSQSSSQSKSQSSSQTSGSQSQSSGSQSQLQSISSSQSGLQSAPNSQSAGLQARLQFKLNTQPSSSQPQLLPKIVNSDQRFQFKLNPQPQLLPQIFKSDQGSQSSGSQSQSSSSSQINAKIQGQLKTQLLGTQSATPSLIKLQPPQTQIPSNPNRMIAGQFPAKIFVPTPAGPTINKKLKSMKPIVFTPEYKIGSPPLPSSHLLPSGILVDSNLTTSPQVQTQLPVKMVVPTLARPRIIQDLKNIKPIVFTPEYKIESPPSYLSLNDILVDSKLDTNNLIEKYGYPSETHFTDTDDGYHLCLHRIPRPNGPPILLVHGLMSSSASWVELGPKNGLAYILYRKGYDVWMLNTRGNKYSRQSNRRQKPRKYWDFSFHEIGKYDLPAAIDLILNHTHKPKIQYIGHSQGSTVFFVMCSERPNYAHKVQLMQALSPTVYLRENRSPVLKFLSMFKGKYAMLLNLLGGYEISTKTKLIEQFKQHICSGSELASRICAIFDFVVCGFDWKSFNKTLTPIVAAHASQGASAKQLYHYAQLHNFKDFHHFDHGEILNRVRYQSPKPPVYNISQALSNVVIHHGPGDWLGSDSDVIRLQERLPNLVESRRVPYDGFSHYDFTLSSDVRPLVYSHVLRHLANIHQG
ncbi:serine-rich adhesin for platelets-like [Drosophila eugracilis]|uniref:serine-rich adhesin for platelets-like n=1 Tax=Drosophila eugracilis TaxID=29029 RepID=UPI001BDB2F1E|nr:serine-rich adhesin for platelets-like [Drosophila eugracilis]